MYNVLIRVPVWRVNAFFFYCRCIGRNYLLNLSETSNVGVLTVNPAISEYKNSIKVDFVSPFFPKSLVVREKEDLVLECAVTGLAKVDMVWKRKSYESGMSSLLYFISLKNGRNASNKTDSRYRKELTFNYHLPSWV